MSKFLSTGLSFRQDNKFKIKILKTNTNSINLGENTLVEVLSPNLNSYDNLNNYSPVIKISYGNTSFLFTGDAEESIEKELISKSFNLKSDLLKIAACT